MKITVGATKTYDVGKITPGTVRSAKNAVFRRGTLESACPPSKIGELNLSDIVKADRAARDFVENEVERTDWQNDVFYGEKRI